MEILVEKVLPNPQQPRSEFDLSALRELAESIRQVGLIQPITVQAAQDGWYVLIDGERRLRAHKLLGKETIEAVIREDDKPDLLLLALVANVQRRDLNPLEEGRAYAQMRRAGLSLTQVALRCGTNSNRVMNRLKLLNLPEPIQALVANGRLPIADRSTDAILGLPAEYQVELAQKLAARPGVTIAAIESAVRRVHELIAVEHAKETYGDGTPAVTLATARVRRNKAAWDMLAQVGKLPPWDKVVDGARYTCGKCSWSDVANAETCKDCPAVELLAKMLEAAQ